MIRTHSSIPTDSEAALHEVIGGDATATFEDDPKFTDIGATGTASSDNVAVQRAIDEGEDEEDDDDLEDEDEEDEDDDLEDEDEDDEDDDLEEDDEDEEDEDADEDVLSGASSPAGLRAAAEEDDDAGDVESGLDEDDVDVDDIDTDRVASTDSFRLI